METRTDGPRLDERDSINIFPFLRPPAQHTGKRTNDIRHQVPTLSLYGVQAAPHSAWLNLSPAALSASRPSQDKAHHPSI